MKLIYRMICLITISMYSFAGNIPDPIVHVAPLWVASEYGWYWGASVSGAVELNRHHMVIATADYAPWGGVFSNETETNGKEVHFGGTLGYQYQFCFANNFLKVSPGIVTGLSSIPNLFGESILDIDPYERSSSSHNENQAERSIIWGLGPDLSIELGRDDFTGFMRARVLFPREYSVALLTNIGVSYAF